MKDNLAGAVWRFAIFAVVCLLGIFALLAIFAQLRYEKENVYHAQFSNITGLKSGDSCGSREWKSARSRRSRCLPDTTCGSSSARTRPVVYCSRGRRSRNPYAGAAASLVAAIWGWREVSDASVLRRRTIPLDHTEPALDLDALIGGFRPLFRALNAGTGQRLVGAVDGGV